MHASVDGANEVKMDALSILVRGLAIGGATIRLAVAAPIAVVALGVVVWMGIEVRRIGGGLQVLGPGILMGLGLFVAIGAMAAVHVALSGFGAARAWRNGIRTARLRAAASALAGIGLSTFVIWKHAAIAGLLLVPVAGPVVFVGAVTTVPLDVALLLVVAFVRRAPR